MLDWLTKNNHLSSGVKEEDDNADDRPDTPAHMFAVKAFKSAIFGTPAPGSNNTQQDGNGQSRIRSFAKGKAKAKKVAQVQDEQRLPSRPRSDSLASPAKGILVTPGTSAARRKTVSFGGLGNDDEADSEDNELLVDEMVSDNDVDSTRPAAGVRRSLFREMPQEDKGSDSPTEPEQIAENESPPALTVPPERLVEQQGDSDPDITIDLRSPRSRSGKHWKQEYQRDHARSKQEMKRLIRHNQATKSFANQKDAEAVDLAEKLESAERRSKELEKKVADLAARLKRKSTSKSAGREDSHLISELASQTAQALRYKQKAEKYKAAMQEHMTPPVSDSDQAEDGARSLTYVPSAHNSKEVLSMRSEMENLKKTAARAESKVSDMEKDNQRLKATLARVKDEMKRYEERHSAREETRKRRDEKQRAQKRALKERIARMEADYQKKITQMEQTHSGDGSEGLRSTSPRSQRFSEKDAVIEQLKAQVRNLKEDAERKAVEAEAIQLSLENQRSISQGLREAPERVRRLQVENDQLKVRDKTKRHSSLGVPLYDTANRPAWEKNPLAVAGAKTLESSGNLLMEAPTELKKQHATQSASADGLGTDPTSWHLRHGVASQITVADRKESAYPRLRRAEAVGPESWSDQPRRPATRIRHTIDPVHQSRNTDRESHPQPRVYQLTGNQVGKTWRQERETQGKENVNPMMV